MLVALAKPLDLGYPDFQLHAPVRGRTGTPGKTPRQRKVSARRRTSQIAWVQSQHAARFVWKSPCLQSLLAHPHNDRRTNRSGRSMRPVAAKGSWITCMEWIHARQHNLYESIIYVYLSFCMCIFLYLTILYPSIFVSSHLVHSCSVTDHRFHPLSILVLCHVSLIYSHFTPLIFLPSCQNLPWRKSATSTKRTRHIHKPNKSPSNHALHEQNDPPWRRL